MPVCSAACRAPARAARARCSSAPSLVSMTASFPATGHSAIGPRTTMGTVHLTVSDLDRSRAFYEQVIGLRSTDADGGGLAMTADDGRELIRLRGDSSAPRLDPRATGLFHLAVLLPSRVDLAFALGRLSGSRWPLDGASDHLVSEALYLSDPDGNGIEIYRDRPREDWTVRDGQLQMATLPLDLRGVAGELASASEARPKVPAGTRIGHVHLQVSELTDTEAFYAGLLGFEVTVRGYPGAPVRRRRRLPPPPRPEHLEQRRFGTARGWRGRTSAIRDPAARLGGARSRPGAGQRRRRFTRARR